MVLRLRIRIKKRVLSLLKKVFAIFHIIFEFFRISILSIIYGIITSVGLNKIFKKFKFKKSFLIPLIFISLFVWRFSYWRNSAFGDNGYVPLSNKYYLHDIDGIVISLENRSKKNHRNSFTISDKLYREGEILYVLDNDKYHIFNIDTEKIYKNLTKKEFESKNGDVNKLMSISKFHQDYWSTLLVLLL